MIFPRQNAADGKNLSDWRRLDVRPEDARRVLFQNATCSHAALGFGTWTERTASESLIERRTPLFTARSGHPAEAAHHIQKHDDPP